MLIDLTLRNVLMYMFSPYISFHYSELNNMHALGLVSYQHPFCLERHNTTYSQTNTVTNVLMKYAGRFNLRKCPQ